MRSSAFSEVRMEFMFVVFLASVVMVAFPSSYVSQYLSVTSTASILLRTTAGFGFLVMRSRIAIVHVHRDSSMRNLGSNRCLLS